MPTSSVGAVNSSGGTSRSASFEHGADRHGHQDGGVWAIATTRGFDIVLSVLALTPWPPLPRAGGVTLFCCGAGIAGAAAQVFLLIGRAKWGKQATKQRRLRRTRARGRCRSGRQPSRSKAGAHKRAVGLGEHARGVGVVGVASQDHQQAGTRAPSAIICNWCPRRGFQQGQRRPRRSWRSARSRPRLAAKPLEVHRGPRSRRSA